MPPDTANPQESDGRWRGGSMSTPRGIAPDSLSEEELDEYGFVLASKYRTEVVRALDGRANGLTPEKVSQHRSIDRSCVGRAIQELAEEGVVKLLVDESRRKGRLYGLTDLGESLAPHLREEAQDA